MAHLRTRISQLEKQRRFLDWYVWERILASLTEDELGTYWRDGKLPELIPNRPSRFDTVDRKIVKKLWEEDERIFAGRSREELKYFTEKGYWPEHRGRFHCFMEDGTLVVEWRIDPNEQDGGLARELGKEKVT
jgi:hypothetical protein